MEKIFVEVERYRSFDRLLFKTEQECIHHEKMLQGIRKICPECKGTKEVDQTGDGRSFSKCDTCSAKGWVEKEEVWK